MVIVDFLRRIERIDIGGVDGRSEARAFNSAKQILFVMGMIYIKISNKFMLFDLIDIMMLLMIELQDDFPIGLRINGIMFKC